MLQPTACVRARCEAIKAAGPSCGQRHGRETRGPLLRQWRLFVTYVNVLTAWPETAPLMLLAIDGFFRTTRSAMCLVASSVNTARTRIL